LDNKASAHPAGALSGATAGHDPSLAGRLRRTLAAGISTAPVPLATAEPELERSCDTRAGTAVRVMPVLRAAADSVAPPSLASSLRARLEPESPSSPPVASCPASGRAPCASAPVCIVMPGGRGGYRQRQLTTAASSGFILNAHSQSTLLLGTAVEADGTGSNASRPTWTVHELDSRTLIVRASQPSLHRSRTLRVSGLLQGRTGFLLRWIAFQLVGSESLRERPAH
jgi:hypothetical protein